MAEITQAAQPWINVVLIWLGVGILAGLAARTLVPGREPQSALGTLLVGMVGSVVGPLLLSLVLGRQSIMPVSPLGLLASIGGAALLLAGLRALVVWLKKEPEEEVE